MKHACTELYGVFGDPVDHSLSPEIQAVAFSILGRPAAYLPFHVPEGQLAAGFTAARTLGLRGFNVTIPHKEEAADLVDGLEGDAQSIRAVNVVSHVEGRLVGFNTDAAAIRKVLELEGVDLREHRALVLGAGGAARAVAWALGTAGAGEVVVANRTFNRARNLCALLSRRGVEAVPSPLSPGALRELVPMSRVVVNATSVGLRAPQESPLPDDLAFGADSLAIDLVYRPLYTRFLEQAHTRGARTVDGLEILVHQAIASLAIWFQQELDEARLMNAMRTAGMEALS